LSAQTISPAKEFRSQKYVTYLSTRRSEASINSDFQLAFAPRQFESNRLMWKVIVQLNLIKYVLQFFQKTEQELENERRHSLSNIRTIIEALFAEYDLSTSTTEASPTARNFRRIRLSLSPLFVIEVNLMQILAPELKDATRDIGVRAGSGWKALLQAHQS